MSRFYVTKQYVKKASRLRAETTLPYISNDSKPVSIISSVPIN